MVDYFDFFCGRLSLRWRLEGLAIHILIVGIFIVVAVLLCGLKETNITLTLRECKLRGSEERSIIKNMGF